jgi:RNA polymerase sigma-70 factor (ECF subfamily)
MIRTGDLARHAEDDDASRQQRSLRVTESPVDFRTVYEAHFDFVWRVLRRLGVREMDALDLTQKVFLTVHVRLETFEGRSQLRTWIFGICQHLASDYRRSARIRHEVTTDVTGLEAGDEGDGPLASMESRQRAVVAEAILDKLPEAQRLVFVLFELEEMSGDEIAALLDVSVGTVRSRLRLAREAIRREVTRLAAGNPRARKAAIG